jgi:hypothetical protein
MRTVIESASKRLLFGFRVNGWALLRLVYNKQKPSKFIRERERKNEKDVPGSVSLGMAIRL